MENYFKSLIEKCQFGELSASDVLLKVAKTDGSKITKITRPAMPHPYQFSKNRASENKTEKEKVKITQGKTSAKEVPSSLLTLSSKANDLDNTTASVENSILVEEPIKSEQTLSIYEKQVQLRTELITHSCEELDLQKYIETQLLKLSEKAGPIKDKAHLEDVKRKLRLKWLLKKKETLRNKLKKEEEEFQANCSFRPKINDSSVSARYWDAQRKPSLEYNNPHLTFTPKLNPNSVSILKNSSRSRSRGPETTSPKIERILEPNNPVREAVNGRKDYLKTIKSKESPTQLQMEFEDEIGPSKEGFEPIQPYPEESHPAFLDERNDSDEELERIQRTLKLDCLNTPLAEDFRKRKNMRTTETQQRIRSPLNKNSNLIKNSNKRSAWEKDNSMQSEKLRESVNNKMKESSVSGCVSASKGKENCTKSHKKNQEVKSKTSSKEERSKWFGEFFNRVQQFKEVRAKKLDEVEKQVTKDYSYKPHISKTAQAAEKWDYDTKVNKFIKEKEEWIQKKREEKSKLELEGVTYQPKINKDIPAVSKLNLGLSTSEYVSKLKEQKEIEEEYANLIKRRQEAMDSIECTYRPQINENPFYLKRELSPSASILKSSRFTPQYKVLHSKKSQESKSSTRSLTNLDTNRRIFLSPKCPETVKIPSLFENI